MKELNEWEEAEWIDREDLDDLMENERDEHRKERLAAYLMAAGGGRKENEGKSS